MDFSNETPTPPSAYELPPFVVLLLLVVAALIGAGIGGGLAYGWANWQGLDLQTLISGLSESSPRPERDAVRMVNFLSHLASFTLPAIMVAMLAYRNRWISYFKLNRSPGSAIFVLGIFFVLVSFPFVQLTYWLNQQLPLPSWATQMETAAEEMIKGILVMESPAELLFNILVVGVLPAIGEELLFRGVVQQQLQRAFNRPVLAIWLTALVFSAIHMQFAGFIPRMVLGAVLGYLFYWSKSLWVPILAHFVTNSMQVVAQYVSGGKLTQMELDKPESANWIAGIVSLAATIALGYYLWKKHQDMHVLTEDRKPANP